jgi:hypothetical protein
MEGGGGSSQGKPRQQVMAGREMHRQLPACRLTCPPPPPSLHPTLPAYPKTPTTNPPPTHPPTHPPQVAPGAVHRPRGWRHHGAAHLCHRPGGLLGKGTGAAGGGGGCGGAEAGGGVVRRFVLHATGMTQCQCRIEGVGMGGGGAGGKGAYAGVTRVTSAGQCRRAGRLVQQGWQGRRCCRRPDVGTTPCV